MFSLRGLVRGHPARAKYSAKNCRSPNILLLFMTVVLTFRCRLIFSQMHPSLENHALTRRNQILTRSVSFFYVRKNGLNFIHPSLSELVYNIFKSILRRSLLFFKCPMRNIKAWSWDCSAKLRGGWVLEYPYVFVKHTWPFLEHPCVLSH